MNHLNIQLNLLQDLNLNSSTYLKVYPDSYISCKGCSFEILIDLKIE